MTVLVRTEEFEALLPEWRDLCRQAVWQSVFTLPDTAWAWWRAFAKGRALRLVLARAEDGRLEGIFPLYMEENSRLLQPLLAPKYADRWDMTVREGRLDEVPRAFAAWLREYPGWDGLRVMNVPAGSSAMGAFGAAAGRLGLRRVVTPAQPCMATDLAGASTLRERFHGTNLLREMRRFGHRVRDAGYTEEFAVSPPTTALLEECIDLDRNRSFGAEYNRSFFQSDEAANFIRFMAEDNGHNHPIALSTLRFNGRLASYCLYFNTDRALLDYITATDGEFSYCHPGILIIFNALQYCLDTGKTKHDFLLGDELYKLRWRAKPSEQETCHVFNRTFAGYGRFLYRAYGVPIRKFLGRNVRSLAAGIGWRPSFLRRSE